MLAITPYYYYYCWALLEWCTLSKGHDILIEMFFSK